MSNDRNERRRAYREANKEAIAEYSKAYSKVNKEVMKAYRDSRSGLKSEYDKVYLKSPSGKFSQIKGEAKKRGIPFDLLREFYESQLWGKPCHYCGCEIEVTGLDRKDNDGDYTPDNVVPCCKKCNNKKRTKPYEQYLAEVRDENNT